MREHGGCDVVQGEHTVRRVVALVSTPPAGNEPPTTQTGPSDRPSVLSDVGTEGETTTSSVFSSASGTTRCRKASVSASARV